MPFSKKKTQHLSLTKFKIVHCAHIRIQRCNLQQTHVNYLFLTILGTLVSASYRSLLNQYTLNEFNNHTVFINITIIKKTYNANDVGEESRKTSANGNGKTQPGIGFDFEIAKENKNICVLVWLFVVKVSNIEQ